MLTEYPIDFFNYVVWTCGVYYVYPIELVFAARIQCLVSQCQDMLEYKKARYR